MVSTNLIKNSLYTGDANNSGTVVSMFKMSFGLIICPGILFFRFIINFQIPYVYIKKD
jgi:hypothetical protein